MKHKLLCCAVMMWAGLHGAQAAEVAKRSGGGGGDAAAMTKLQAMLQQVTGERDALQGELEKAQGERTKNDEKHKKEIALLTKKIEGLENTSDRSQDALTRTNEANTTLRDRNKEQQERMQKLVDKYKELVENLRLVEGDKSVAQTKVAEQERRLGDCSVKNTKLYEVNLELLDRYENKGVWDALLQREPVTQLKRVEIEGVVEEYKYKISQQRVQVQPVVEEN